MDRGEVDGKNLKRMKLV